MFCRTAGDDLAAGEPFSLFTPTQRGVKEGRRICRRPNLLPQTQLLRVGLEYESKDVHSGTLLHTDTKFCYALKRRYICQKRDTSLLGARGTSMQLQLHWTRDSDDRSLILCVSTTLRFLKSPDQCLLLFSVYYFLIQISRSKYMFSKYAFQNILTHNIFLHFG